MVVELASLYRVENDIDLPQHQVVQSSDQSKLLQWQRKACQVFLSYVAAMLGWGKPRLATVAEHRVSFLSCSGPKTNLWGTRISFLYALVNFTLILYPTATSLLWQTNFNKSNLPKPIKLVGKIQYGLNKRSPIIFKRKSDLCLMVIKFNHLI